MSLVPLLARLWGDGGEKSLKSLKSLVLAGVPLTVPNPAGYPEVFGNSMIFPLWAQLNPAAVAGGVAWAAERLGAELEQLSAAASWGSA